MAVKRCEANIDVVKAAEIRIKNVFGNGLPVFFSFSGGKDSLCVAQLMVNPRTSSVEEFSFEWGTGRVKVSFIVYSVDGEPFTVDSIIEV